MGTLQILLGIIPLNIVLLLIYKKASYQYHWFDTPNESRKIHNTAIPTSSGLVFMLPIILTIAWTPNIFLANSWVIALCVMTLLIVGGIDDFKSIGIKFRLLIISTVSGVLIYLLLHGSGLPHYLLIVYLVGMIWWLNLFNFMDGADGIAILHAVVTTFGYLCVFTIFGNDNFSIVMSLLVFLLCQLSFLFFNFPNAKMFMGDSGSMSIAFVLACFALYGISISILDEILVISFHLVFIVDTTMTLITRLKFKHNISQAHNLHCFQAIISSGKSHTYTTLLYTFITTINVIIALYSKQFSINMPIRLGVLLTETTVLLYFWYYFQNKTKFKRFKQ